MVRNFGWRDMKDGQPDWRLLTIRRYLVLEQRIRKALLDQALEEAVFTAP